MPGQQWLCKVIEWHITYYIMFLLGYVLFYFLSSCLKVVRYWLKVLWLRLSDADPIFRINIKCGAITIIAVLIQWVDADQQKVEFLCLIVGRTKIGKELVPSPCVHLNRHPSQCCCSFLFCEMTNAISLLNHSCGRIILDSS